MFYIAHSVVLGALLVGSGTQMNTQLDPCFSDGLRSNVSSRLLFLLKASLWVHSAQLFISGVYGPILEIWLPAKLAAGASDGRLKFEAWLRRLIVSCRVIEHALAFLVCALVAIEWKTLNRSDL